MSRSEKRDSSARIGRKLRFCGRRGRVRKVEVVLPNRASQPLGYGSRLIRCLCRSSATRSSRASRGMPSRIIVIGAQLDLFDWPRTCDENVHKSLGALLPVGAGGDIRHANQRAEQINRVEVFSYVAALDGALYQRPNRIPNLSVGGFENLGSCAEQGI